LFNCIFRQAVYSNPSRLRDSRLINSEDDGPISSDLLLMGIMASDVRMAMRGFRDWCGALGLEFVIPENRVREHWRARQSQGGRIGDQMPEGERECSVLVT